MFISIALIPVFRGLAVKMNVMDIPDDRKLHLYAMPRTGGLAMAFAIFISVLVWPSLRHLCKPILVGMVIIVTFGLLDDIKGLSYKGKFFGQVTATLVVIFYGGIKITSLGTLLPDHVFLPDWIAIPLTLVLVVGVTDAINLSDGLDGLAGGVSLLIFLCIGYLAYQDGNLIVAVMAVAVIGAIFGFLRFNTYPATIFMGDTGSQLLGFTGITLAIKLTQDSFSLSPILPLILFGFPILDTLYVMLHRVIQGRSPFQADNDHFHYKLIRLGFFHTEAVLFIYIIQSILVMFALFFKSGSDRILLIGYVIFSSVILSFFIITEKSGYKIGRYDIIDKVVKGKLRALRDRGILIKFCSEIVETGIPLLTIFLCFLPAFIPKLISLLALAFLCLLVFCLKFRRDWLSGSVRLSIYFLMPCIIYFSEIDPVGWMSKRLMWAYNLSFAGLVFFVILTLKFTRRKEGFRATPMDFLILFIALVVPNLPAVHLQNYYLGMLTSKIIALFFSYEVLIGELRGKLKRLSMAVIFSLFAIFLRGMLI